MFTKGYGHDIIVDFEDGIDQIDVSGWTGIEDIGEIEIQMSSSNGDVQITLGKDVLRIAGTSGADIDITYFIFEVV